MSCRDCVGTVLIPSNPNDDIIGMFFSSTYTTTTISFRWRSRMISCRLKRLDPMAARSLTFFITFITLFAFFTLLLFLITCDCLFYSFVGALHERFLPHNVKKQNVCTCYKFVTELYQLHCMLITCIFACLRFKNPSSSAMDG